MKPEYEIIAEPPERSFTAKIVARKSRPLLSQAWHYHPEIEICFTRESSGKRFVGNQISDYQIGDLVMFGSNLPHGFTTDIRCSQVVIQMTEDFLGMDFIQKPELRQVQSLFERAKQGLEFGAEVKKKAKKAIKKMMNAQGFAQMIHLFELLNLLATTKDVDTICSEEYSLDLNATSLSRLKIVYDYIVVNYQKEVRIKEVAALINLTEAAFFKFIKKHTKKTYTQIINEFRINHASKLLMTTDLSIAEICFECGYNNVSYFNRKFKAVIGKTPSDFRVVYA
ncbi:MAG: AraC family transcriptional regulator [Bacteroidota bacterium]